MGIDVAEEKAQTMNKNLKEWSKLAINKKYLVILHQISRKTVFTLMREMKIIHTL